MPITLDEWQKKLEGHFSSLAARRAPSGLPLFALEHGLGPTELEDIRNQLLARLQSGAQLYQHWLVWAVYATERGYHYAGDEYWRSFEEHTPCWDARDRYRLIRWFTKFQETYRGVVPTGPWAGHFRIIAWPITHAVLPRYLQPQFAKTLYDLRFLLAGISHRDPAAIGHTLALRAHASTRFAEFLQQEELTGRIVLALLHADPEGGPEPIYGPTLERLVGDLERVREAREWLHEAKRVVADRFKGLGHSHGKGWHTPHSNLGEPSQAPAQRRSLRPDLRLRYAGDEKWSVVLEIPDFGSVTANAESRGLLQSTRCLISGAGGFKPSGWLVGTNRRAILKSWPDPEKPLIQLERSNGTLDHLVASDCRLSAGPLWLFRIGNDGLAREIVGKFVRPGQEYVVVTTDMVPEPDLVFRSCEVSCTGVKSFRIAVPLHVSAAETAWLNKVGLAVARTIRVWPAGLPGRGWDGEGHVEVLTTEAAAFGIVHDHPIESYSIRLDGGEKAVIEAGRVGYPTFIRLPQLAPGTHTLVVKATRDPSQFTQPVSPDAEGFLLLSVREPEPWIPGRAAHHGLIVEIDPNEFDLAALWEDRVRVSVIGPESHHVLCRIELSGPRGEQLLSQNISEPMALPVAAETWSRTFKRFVGSTDVASRYLEATSGRLIISAEELGEYVADFEREALPLRWVLTRREDDILVRLIDDTGDETGEPDCAFFPLQKPLHAEAVPASAALAGRAAEVPGGLFVAKHGAYQDRILVSAGLAGSGLQGLGVVPDFSEVDHGSIGVAEACRVLALWSEARLVGFLPDIRLQQVVDGLISAIFAKLCGHEWARAEKALLYGQNTQRSFDALQRCVDRSNGFASVLRRDYAQMNRDFPEGVDWFADLTARYRICADRKLSKFALFLASQPQRIATECGGSLELLVSRTAETPAVLRGARFLALLAANEEGVPPLRLLPRWTWS